jgi:hypothetical protein
MDFEALPLIHVGQYRFPATVNKIRNISFKREKILFSLKNLGC